MKKRNFLIRVAQIIITILAVFAMFKGGASLVTSWYSNDMKVRLDELDASLNAARENSVRDSKYLEFIDSEIAKYVTFCLKNNPEAAGSAEELDELCEILNVENILIADSEGNIITEARHDDDMADLKSPYYSGLLEVSPENPISEFYYSETLPTISASALNETSIDDSDDSEDELIREDTEDTFKETEVESFIRESQTYYVSGYFAPNRFVVVKNSSMQFRQYLSGYRSKWQSLISVSKYGKSGFFFLATSNGYVLNYPESDSVIESLSDLSLPNAVLKDGYTRRFNLKGKLYFCRSHSGTWTQGEDTITIICAVPVIEIYSTVLFVILLPCIIIIVSIMVMRLFAKYLVASAAGKSSRHDKAGAFHRRLGILTLICMLCTVLAGVFSNVLYFYAQQFQADTKRAGALAAALDDMPLKQASGFDVYDSYLTILTKTASYVLSHNTDYRSREKLEELRDLLHAKHLLVYNTAGKVIASDLNYNGISLSDNPDDLSSQFMWVIRGEPILIQKELDEKHLGAPFLFSGAPIITHEGSYNGLVQLAMNPDIYYRITDSSSLSSTLNLFDRGDKNSAFAIEKGSSIVNASDYEYDGQPAESIGFNEGQLTAGFTGFVRLLGRDLLCSCDTSDAYTACIVTDPSDLPIYGLRSGLILVIPGIIAEVLLYIILAIYCISFLHLSEDERKLLRRESKTSSAECEANLIHVLHRFLAVMFIGIVFCEIFRKSLFDVGSLGYFIFTNHWSEGLHIFSVTRCLIVGSCAIFIIEIIMKLLSALTALLPGKQETFVRMLLSLLKYAGFLGTFFYCATLIGIPTASLLAPAGVLALVFSMGSQTLVADILSGIFILFEGTFHVGDMITVDSWHGQVIEIGIRNTKIRDLINSDIKVMNNSTIKNVINHSVYPAYVSTTIGIDYDCELREIEEIIEREKPVLKNNIPLAIGDITYLGVDSFDDSAVILKFQASCRDQDTLKVRRALNRELKLMFDRNGIGVPFPQVVISERGEKVTGGRSF